MTDETYKLARELKEDIKKLNNQIKEKEEKRHWITISTPDNSNNGASSMRFQKELLDWMKQTRDKYQEEFDSL